MRGPLDGARVYLPRVPLIYARSSTHSHGDLLELRPLRPGDWPALFAVAADPLMWEQHPDSDRYKEDVFRQFFEDALRSGGALVAVDRATGKIIGSSRYYDFNPTESAVEIGWTFLSRRYWGGKYNREMKRLMLTHAFKAVERVVFIIGPDNHRSRRAIEKIGGVYAGVRSDTRGRESVAYEITRSCFAAGPLAGAV
jgi:RimJ/RimL family protein N-acetyltransferase